MSASEREVTAPKHRVGRIVFFAAFAGLVLWGASLYQQRYPVGFEIRYVYRGLHDASRLKSVRATLTSGRKVVSVIRFFHPEPLADGAVGVVRRQRVFAPRGPLHVSVECRYRGGTRRILRRKLQISDSGGVFQLHLRHARAD